MSDVIRLSKEDIEGLEKLRKNLIEYYTSVESDAPDLLKYDVDKWENASYSNLIGRAIFTANWYFEHQ